MKAEEHILGDAEKFPGYDFTYLENPIDRNTEFRKELDIFDRINELYPSTKKIKWVKNLKVIAENKYNKPIPLNRIGLLSENFKRIKYYENNMS